MYVINVEALVSVRCAFDCFALAFVFTTSGVFVPATSAFYPYGCVANCALIRAGLGEDLEGMRFVKECS